MSPALLVLQLLSYSPEFCAGYRQGFTAAYCRGHQFCNSAPVPSCPDEDGSWHDGYDRGFNEGETAHGADHE